MGGDRLTRLGDPALAVSGPVAVLPAADRLVEATGRDGG